jgi:uncharacterized protein YukE
MKRIRVNTEELKAKAKDFDSAASIISKAGDDILAVAMSMPSYDGQLSGPARAAGSEIQKQGRSLRDKLSSDAESLRETAKAFENEDNKTVSLLKEKLEEVSAPYASFTPGTEFDVPLKKGGNHDWLGYEDHGSYVIMWKNGESIKIYKTKDNQELIEQYEKAVDEYCENLAELLATLRELILRDIDILKVTVVIAVLVILGLMSQGIMLELIGVLGISAELLGLAMDDAQELVVHYGTEFKDEIIEFLSAGLDPANPSKNIEDITDIIKYAQAASQSRTEAENIWDSLAPPSSSESSDSTNVRPPTPPSPTQTPTPTPTPKPKPTETPPPNK